MVTIERSFRKKDDKVYYNLRASDVELVKSTESDMLSGTLEFKGKIGKRGIKDMNDKKGDPYMVFSAFSSDRNGDKNEFTWVTFLYFKPEGDLSFLKEQALIHAMGDMQVGVYQDNISLDCRISEIEPWNPKTQS